ncbi:hypothetical protein B224_p00015 (plasmid) [Aeromonas media WS]|nr:hypothetical protein B224_p00015 [Aeromonas media WS]
MLRQVTPPIAPVLQLSYGRFGLFSTYFDPVCVQMTREFWLSPSERASVSHFWLSGVRTQPFLAGLGSVTCIRCSRATSECDSSHLHHYSTKKICASSICF